MVRSHSRAARETRRSRVTSLDTRKGVLVRRLSYVLIKCLFVAICRKIFKLWFLRYKRKVIHRHLCRALAKKVRSLFKIVDYKDSSLSLKPTLLEATLSVCLREVSVCCLRSWRVLIMLLGSLRYHDGDGRLLKSEFAFFQSLYRLLQLICLIKHKRTLFEPNS